MTGFVFFQWEGAIEVGMDDAIIFRVHKDRRTGLEK